MRKEVTLKQNKGARARGLARRLPGNPELAATASLRHLLQGLPVTAPCFQSADRLVEKFNEDIHQNGD